MEELIEVEKFGFICEVCFEKDAEYEVLINLSSYMTCETCRNGLLRSAANE